MDVFEKFPNIKFIETYGAIENEEQFAWLLGKCPKLSELRFIREYLGQSLLNRLPVVCRNLKNLSIGSCEDNAVPLDLSPLYELRLLFSLQIRSDDASPNGAFDLGTLLEKCRYLTFIDLGHIRIWKDGLYEVFTKQGFVRGGS